MPLLKDLNGKSVCILGYGKEGQSVLKALEKCASKCNITIADNNDDLKIKNSKLKIHTKLGSTYLDNLDEYDIIIKSPGIPPGSKLIAYRSKLTNALQIFLEESKTIGATVIGVTGTKGKSTVTALLGYILKKADLDARIGGNIGTPVLDILENATNETIFVVEMSSYQLMDISISPHISIITSFFPEHLDYHGSLNAYTDAKKHAVKFQSEKDFVFILQNDENTQSIAAASKGTIIKYSKDDSLVTIDETKLIGKHNLLNIAGVCKVAKHLEIDTSTIISAITEFTGLPHRLENLGTHHEIIWIDDSISTIPETTIAALDALGENVKTLICGGLDRGLDFTKLGEAISASKIKTVILFPETGKKIFNSIKSDSIQSIEVNSMEEAVKFAKLHTHSSQLTAHSSIVLLSPASPSYNLFKNFEERGDEFVKCVIH